MSGESKGWTGESKRCFDRLKSMTRRLPPWPNKLPIQSASGRPMSTGCRDNDLCHQTRLKPRWRIPSTLLGPVGGVAHVRLVLQIGQDDAAHRQYLDLALHLIKHLASGGDRHGERDGGVPVRIEGGLQRVSVVGCE